MSKTHAQLENHDNDRRAIVADSLIFGIVFAIGLTAFQRIIGFLRGILFCKYMTEEELGSWSLAWSFLMLLAPLAVLGLPGTFPRFVEHFRQRGQLKIFFLRICGFSVAGTMLLVGILSLRPTLFAELLFRNPAQTDLLWMLVISLIFVGALNFATSFTEALRQVRLSTIMRFVSGVSFALLSLVFIFAWESSAVAVTASFAVSCLIGLLPAIWFFARYWNTFEVVSPTVLSHRSMWKKIAPFAMWLWLANLATNGYEIVDRYMLLHLLPLSASEAQGIVGQYHSARVVPLLMVSLAAVLSGILLPYIAAAWEEKRYQDAKVQVSWTLKLTGLLITSFSVIVAMGSSFLFDTVLDGRYNAGLSVLPMTLTYCVWYSMVLVGQDYLWCRDKGKWVVAAYVVGLVVNIGLNYFLIPSFGLGGAVWATFLSTLACLLFLLLSNFVLGLPMSRGIIFVTAVPLLTMIPPWTAAFVLIIIIWAGIYYRWIFDDQEVKQLNKMLEKGAGLIKTGTGTVIGNLGKIS
ncbi:MAG TPA: oligosaccharide flippase family protein [Pirellulaceae bacterium]|mgnify:CR=1 FL=1|nr:oligosaccharide flippase family protein [Pirellulaceae bacterium]HMO93111.1 oligosaccharide flippase family protein [Pirellulaceae bacterium]HMP70330.1 oligosaccharide flippase family protein [Pirellulaceae bacterium]